MGAESNMRRYVVDILADLRLDPVSVENPSHPGTPDVNYLGGWIELKQIDRWPAKADSVVRVDHFTPPQRIWLRRRVRAGGDAWVLLRVGKGPTGAWFLFRGDVAADRLGYATRDELRELATMVCGGGLDRDALGWALTGGADR